MSTYLGILEKNLFHSEDVIKTDISECVSYSWAKKYTKTFMKSDSLTKYAKNFINDVITEFFNFVAVDDHDFGNLFPNSHQRVERRKRILEDHPNLRPSDLMEFFFRNLG